MTVDFDFTLVRLHQADEVFQQHTLPAAAPSDDDERIAGPDGDVDAAEDLLWPNRFFQAAHRDHWDGSVERI